MVEYNTQNEQTTGWTDRRTLLKTASAVSAGGLLGIVGAGGAAASQPDGPTIKIESDNGGTYLVVVDKNDVVADDDATDDNIKVGSNEIYFQGDIDAGETHTFHTDHANIYEAILRDDILLSVWDPLGMNRSGDLTVDGRNSDYLVAVTDDLSADGDTGMINGNQATGGGSEYLHEYEGDGTIMEIHALSASSSYSRVHVTHDL